MELRKNIDYNQILNLILQLPIKDIEKLASALQNGIFRKKEGTKKNLMEIILSSPTWSEEEYNKYLEAKTHLNNTRLL